MLLIRNEFDLPNPSKERFDRIFQGYYQRFEELNKSIQDKPSGEAGVQALKEAINDAAARLPDFWRVISEAYQLQRTDPDRATEKYRQGVDQFPNAAPLLGNYANFLCDVRKDYDAAEAMYKRVLEADPKHAINLGNYANFLGVVRKDSEAAEAMYKRALEADPKLAHNLGNYAIFLSDVRKDYGAAEAMYKRALEADPKHAINLGNYARLLLASGRSRDGLAVLDRADPLLRETKQPQIELECAFYRFAHSPLSHQKAALQNIRKLVEQGVRSPGWDLSRNIDRAIRDGHSEALWLGKLANVVNDDAQPGLLSGWPAWQDAAPA
jgi:Tfp pilus assembly protein PilF